MTAPQFGLLLFLTLSVYRAHAQWPLGPNFMDGFFRDMSSMMGNMQTMTRNMAAMGQNIYSENMERARAAGAAANNLRPGERRVFDDGNTRGFAYRSPSGSFSSYSFSSGTPGSGFMYYSGPDGNFQRRW